MSDYQHLPVLLHDAIAGLAIKETGFYIDATFGRGGHSHLILQHVNEQGQLMAIDQDQTAVNAATKKFGCDPRFSIVQASFANLAEIVQQKGWMGKVDGILFDIGVSSPQFDDADRGFSFQNDGPLDMRMDQTQTRDAAQWINHVPESELANIFFEYGEERFSRRIAKAIVLARAEKRITRTGELAQIIKEAHPRWEPNKHPATRCFQAIRIFINQELSALEHALNASLTVLNQGGRLVVISFHSLEDRIVKQFIEQQAKGDILPRHLPVKNTKPITLKKIGKAIKASTEEVAHNVRARSAILRVAEKL